MSVSKVWLITGTSRGFGRIWAEAALSRGDKVVATARHVQDIDDLNQRFGKDVLTLQLDVTNAQQCVAVVQQGHAHFGWLDVIVNNAGWSLMSTVEEAPEADVRALFDANFFGPLRVVQAALPLLRAQCSGHIIGVSSSLSITSPPLIGFYATTKWAVEALHESLAVEVKSFGIKVTLIEPGAYSTEFGKSAKRIAPTVDAYNELRQQFMSSMAGLQRGDPQTTAGAVMTLVDTAEPPLRLPLGADVVSTARSVYAERLASWDKHEAVAVAAHGRPVNQP